MLWTMETKKHATTNKPQFRRVPYLSTWAVAKRGYFVVQLQFLRANASSISCRAK